MRKQFARLGLPAQRWPAVDGRGLDVSKLVDSGELRKEALQRLLLPDDQKVFGIDLTPGALGCALSHMHIWIDIMQRSGRGELDENERSDIFLVVEDDCEFLPDFSEELFKTRFAEVPDDWQLVFLGGVDAIGLQMLLQISPGVRRVYNGSRETTAYAINVQGARAALEECFPLMWQLDTQMTLRGRPCDFNPELVYTTRPMSYIFWPPLVEQNKEDFSTDVQKDEHPRYMYGEDNGKTYSVLLRTMDEAGLEERASPAQDDEEGAEFAAALAMFAPSQRYSLVGSWDNWKAFHHFRPRSSEDTALWAEVEVPGGKGVEFQLVCDNDWNKRLFPTPQGDIMLGPSSAAHGNNWKLQVPVRWSVLHINWEPQGAHPLQYSFCEPAQVALSRSYALTGSWDGWTSTTELEKIEAEGTTYASTIAVPAGQEVEFQVVCNGDWRQRMYPSPTGDKVLGPNQDGHGKNWKLAAPPRPALVHVRWDPTGRRTIQCRFDYDSVGSAVEGARVRWNITT